MTPRRAFSLVTLLLILLLAFSSLYTVNEGQKGLLLRLGKIVNDSATGKAAVKNPGLHWKFPFINQARLFDVRLQTMDIKSSRIVTREKKDVLVDYYVKWRIEDLPLYFTRTGGNEFRAETLLEQKLNDSLRAEFGKRDISEVVSGERSDIMSLLLSQAKKGGTNLGIEVVDVRIKRIDLPTEVSAAVYERMRAERERIANEHRAEGKAVAEAIRAKADANVTVTLAKARGESSEIRGNGNAKAAKIYADAYSKDVEFYAFIRSLSAYKDSFSSKKDMLVLQPGSQFFNYFNQIEKKQKTA